MIFLLILCSGIIFGIVIFYHNKISILTKENITFKIENENYKKTELQYQENLQFLKEESAQNTQRAIEFAEERFKNLSHQLFEHKAKQFKEDSKETISNILAPFRDQLKTFHENIDKQNRTNIELKKEVEMMQDRNKVMINATENLTKALKSDAKSQGVWGEMILREILIAAGLERNKHFIEQGSGLQMQDEFGSAQKPDFIIKIPNDNEEHSITKGIIIDSKVSLKSYDDYCNNGNLETDLNMFKLSVKNHIDGLAGKKYHYTEKIITPEYTLMFMPIEGAYSLIIQQDRNIFDYAWKKNIILTCPSMLFGILRTIANLWKFDTQNKNALKIAECGGRLYDKFVLLTEAMNDIQDGINKTQNSYNTALNRLQTGAGNLISQAENLRQLGVKSTKQINHSLINNDEEN